MAQLYAMFFFFTFIFDVAHSDAVQPNMNIDSECYTPNGVDYNGKQSTTYVKGSGSYEPAEPYIEECLPWKNQTLDFNTTMELPENYCRNPNGRLFPWCFVSRDGTPTFSYCHIPTCSTPALMGCFKLYVSGDPPPKDKNVTTTGPPPDLILDGEDSDIGSEKMRVGGCLNYCRSREYKYAGVTGGDSCMCGKEDVDGPQMRDELNHIPPRKCLQYECTGDRMQACGGDDAIAIYDVDAGSCGGIIYQKDSGVIYSPRWPGKYAHNLTCGWTIYIPDRYLKDDKTRSSHKIIFSFRYFNLGDVNDTLKIYTYSDQTDTDSVKVANFTGNYIPAPVEQNFTDVIALHIVFQSNKEDKHDGFIMLFNITNLEGEMETTLPDIVVTEPTTTSTTTTTTTTKPASKGTTKSSTTTTASTTSTTPRAAHSILPGATRSTTTTNNTLQTKSGQIKKNSYTLDSGKIAGIVIGVLVFLILVALLVAVILKYKRNQAPKDISSDNPPTTFNNPVSFNNDTTL